mmetsp:Transcript_6386/g.14720  ORF Transcript_6386/g.14720 Transcript_6386/m.14720 type:complete len:231 (+) Transcript_6386:46-738(+)
MTKLAFVCTLLVAWCPREVGAFGFVPDSLARKLQQSALDEKIAVTPASEKGGEPGFGDLTGGLETALDYLPQFTPLERIAITATGNLQRIISSYYNCPVTVTPTRNEVVGNGVFEREVDLSVELATGVVRFATARSTVVVRDPEVEAAIDSGMVGVGQLFRFYDILPKFRLIDAGRNPGSFWRQYELSSEKIRCSIREEFRADTFELHKSETMRTAGKSWLQSKNAAVGQ